jgi:penicillin V acylase-like amidase (Ntn superfamily)
MCTRILWSSEGTPGSGTVLAARTMDWFEDTKTDLWALPRGVPRTGGTDGETLQWTSRYGSVVAAMYGAVTCDGINERGFAANGLYLAEADYGARDLKRPGIGLPICLQYFLDNFATVAEALAWARGSDFQIVPALLGGRPGTAHVSLEDPSGDSAIIEFIGGEMHVHAGPQYQIMANSPTYDEQLARVKQYEGFGGTTPLPGSTDSPDRFVRAAYYAAHLPETTDVRTAIAEVLSVARNASAPFGTADPARPNISTTRWRIVSDLTHRTYYFESATSPNIVWVQLDELGLDSAKDARKLDMVHDLDRVGDVTGQFVVSQPFQFPTVG